MPKAKPKGVPFQKGAANAQAQHAKSSEAKDEVDAADVSVPITTRLATTNKTLRQLEEQIETLERGTYHLAK